jgi:hypothetical protein
MSILEIEKKMIEILRYEGPVDYTIMVDSFTAVDVASRDINEAILSLVSKGNLDWNEEDMLVLS